MALRDFLNLVSEVSVIKTISSPDGMGGVTSTSSTTIIPLAAMWQNGSVNRWISDRYEKNSSHQLVFEYGAYTFGVAVTGATVLETVNYNGETYETVGFSDNIMQLNEIVQQALERTS